MVGGGTRRDNGVQNGVNKGNVFAALDSLRKKKKSEQSKNKSPASEAQGKQPEQVIWNPTSLTVKSWADADDDDDYFATAEPLHIPASWGNPEPEKSQEIDESLLEEELESEDDLDNEDDIDDNLENETEDQGQTETTRMESTPSLAAQKETERQLSKKELKKKELAELDAVLAELGITDRDRTSNSSELQGKKPEPANGDVTKDDASSLPESKTSKKKKKKKDKAAKEGKDAQEQPEGTQPNTTEEEAANQAESASNMDMKECLMKIASMKKKSSKEKDAAAKSAAAEAAARNAKLAAAKKKEKNHYNQQPVR